MLPPIQRHSPTLRPKSVFVLVRYESHAPVSFEAFSAVEGVVIGGVPILLYFLNRLSFEVLFACITPKVCEYYVLCSFNLIVAVFFSLCLVSVIRPVVCFLLLELNEGAYMVVVFCEWAGSVLVSHGFGYSTSYVAWVCSPSIPQSGRSHLH